jgi:hypothetical protein
MTILLGLPMVGGAWLSSGPAADGVPAAATWPDPSDTTPQDLSAPGGQERTLVLPEVGDLASPVYPTPGESPQEWVCAVDAEHDRCLPSKIASVIPESAEARNTPSSSAVPPAAQPAVEAIRPAVPDAPSIDRTVPLEPGSAEDWRPLIALFFAPSDVDRAVEVVQCESRGRAAAKNPRSTASGLFQHLASLWPERAEKAGYAGSDVFDPVANTAVAAWLVYDGGGWRHWNASRGCWS